LFLTPGDVTVLDIRHTVTNIVQRVEGATMTENATTVTEQADTAAPATVEDEVLAEELLVEEVSIDGMCGVY
jgi:mycofactocin precursor